MLRFSLAFLTGVVSLWSFSWLPILDWNVIWWLSGVSVALFLLLNRARSIYLLALLVVFGFIHAGDTAQTYLDTRLGDDETQEDRIIEGRVVGLPRREGHVQRFLFDTDQGESPPTRLRLSWYHAGEVLPDTRWRLEVRLKPPHGFMNPGGFDYEAWLMQQGIHATGYVRGSDENRLIGHAPGVDTLRHRINQHIDAHADSFPGVLRALATGDRSDIESARWRQLIRTGTNHLIAISGLHIGLAAMFAFISIRYLLPVRSMRRIPAQYTASVVAVIFAAGYAVLAGMAIPTQRALIMLCLFVLALLSRRSWQAFDIWGAALMLVLLLDPASIHSPGFWFSFIAVAVILLLYRSGLHRYPRWGQLIFIQITLSLSLLPISMYAFQQGSLSSVLANLVMVPYVSLFVVPVILISILVLPVSEALSALLVSLADSSLAAIWPLITILSEPAYAVLTDVGVSTVLLLMVVCLGAIWQRKILYALPVVFAMPFFGERTSIAQDDFVVDVLDVGQGTSVIIRTAEHTVIYDTGARMGERLDAGSAVVVPFLRYHGIDEIEMMIISHGDNDHRGGAASILEAYPDTGVMSSIDVSAAGDQICVAGQEWVLDGVRFQILHPSVDFSGSENDRSCVMRVSSPSGSILLTGDIEDVAEASLTRRNRLQRSDVILVPHHGSRTSSSRSFITAAGAEVAVITAGYRNRYRLPAADIVQRYRDLGTAVHITGVEGAVQLSFDGTGGWREPVLYRREYGRYWTHRPSR